MSFLCRGVRVKVALTCVGSQGSHIFPSSPCGWLLGNETRRDDESGRLTRNDREAEEGYLCLERKEI
jgi:hypothetical protein